MDANKHKQALSRKVYSFRRSIPIVLGVFMLLAIAATLIPKSLYGRVFTGNQIIDPLIGASLGSITGGNPVTS